MASTTSTNSRRTAVMLAMRSISVSGRATSPTSVMVSSVIRRSPRVGGSVARVRSAMGGLLAFDLVGEQEIVDALFQRAERRRADVGGAEMVGIELGFHPPRMRRQHEDAA